MKNNYIILAAMAILSLAACKKEIDGPTPGSRVRTFTAGFGTKTSVTYNEGTHKYSIAWEAGDKVSLFDGAANNVFTAQSAGASTTLTGEADEAATYYALYPYAAAASMTGTTIATVIPANAAVTADGASHFANISAAKTTGTELDFATVTGVLRFTLGAEATGVSQIVISAVGGESIAGNVSIDMSGEPALSVTSGVSAITVTPATGSVIEPGHTYYVAAAPATLTSGISLEFTTAGGTVTKTQDKALTISAGSVMNLGVINDLSAPAPVLGCPYWHNFANGDFGIGPVKDWGGWEDGYYFEQLTNPYVLSEATWSITDAGYYEWAGTEGWRKGIQLGTGGMTVASCKLSSSSFPGEITKVTLGYNSGITDGASLSVSCTVGGAAFGSTVYHGDGDYEAIFTGSAAGEIAVTLSSTTNGALYLYYIAVEYDPDGTPQTPDPGSEVEKTAGFQDLTSADYDVEW